MLRKTALSAIAAATFAATALVGATVANAGYGGYYNQGNGYYYKPPCYYEYYWVYDPYTYRYVQKRRKVCY
jgi:hypothetical protein